MNFEGLTTLGLIAVMVVGFYFLVIRPTRNRQKEQTKTLESATPGSRVMTASGVIGTVARMGERQALIEIAPGVTITVVKQAIVQVLADDDNGEFADDALPADDDLSSGDDLANDDARDELGNDASTSSQQHSGAVTDQSRTTEAQPSSRGGATSADADPDGLTTPPSDAR